MSYQMKHLFDSIETTSTAFEKVDYLTSQHIATTVYLSFHLDKPLLIEGPAGVGKTELAKKTAEMLGVPLIRLQCYEGLDESKALYEWKYGKQLLYTQILKDKLNDLAGGLSLEDSIKTLHRFDDIFFTDHFLEPRPLLLALQQENGCVLLVDEIDKADDEFEAFMLEVLSDFQVSIPEIGTLKARTKPIVFLTSNNTRDLTDALKRRCLHLFIPLPGPKLERQIVRLHVPAIDESLNRQLVSFVQKIRELDIKKVPSVSETIDWARALILLQRDNLSLEIVQETLHALLKFETDIETAKGHIPEMLRQITAESHA